MWYQLYQQRMWRQTRIRKSFKLRTDAGLQNVKRMLRHNIAILRAV
jgi:hypothetical protein